MHNSRGVSHDGEVVRLEGTSDPNTAQFRRWILNPRSGTRWGQMDYIKIVREVPSAMQVRSGALHVHSKPGCTDNLLEIHSPEEIFGEAAGLFTEHRRTELMDCRESRGADKEGPTPINESFVSTDCLPGGIPRLFRHRNVSLKPPELERAPFLCGHGAWSENVCDGNDGDDG